MNDVLLGKQIRRRLGCNPRTVFAFAAISGTTATGVPQAQSSQQRVGMLVLCGTKGVHQLVVGHAGSFAAGVPLLLQRGRQAPREGVPLG